MRFRELEEHAELRAAETLQRGVWGMPDTEVVPAHLLIAVRHAGGLVAGALENEELVGFLLGFPHWVRGQPGLHSHMLVVHPDHQGSGVGEALKWFQREWCLARGLPLVRWTFDPLQAANAHLNLDKLGATGIEYLPDLYGELEGPLHQGVPTDRMLVEWRLLSPRTASARGGLLAPPEDPGPLVTPLEDGIPADVEEAETRTVRVAVPEVFPKLLAHDPEAARAWRLVSRKAFLRYMGAGYVARALVRKPEPALVLVRD